jgi:hypothetical protein
MIKTVDEIFKKTKTSDVKTESKDVMDLRKEQQKAKAKQNKTEVDKVVPQEAPKETTEPKPKIEEPPTTRKSAKENPTAAASVGVKTPV